MSEAETNPPDAAGAAEPRGSGPAPEPPAAPVSDTRGPFSDPWLRFALLFGALALACEVLYYGVLVGSEALDLYLRGLAQVSARLLGLLGFEATVRGAMLSSDGFSVQIAEGCDAIQICALLSCAIVAFPVALSAKLWGLVVGIGWLQLLNQTRIVSLVLIGRHHESLFKSAHLTIWPSVLIVVTVATWIVWVRLATRHELPAAEA